MKSKYLHEFTFIKMNRIMRNKNNDLSVSIRIRDNKNNSFHNASIYVKQENKRYLNFIRSLKSGNVLELYYTVTHVNESKQNLNILHIEKLK